MGNSTALDLVQLSRAIDILNNFKAVMDLTLFFYCEVSDFAILNRSKNFFGDVSGPESKMYPKTAKLTLVLTQLYPL